MKQNATLSQDRQRERDILTVSLKLANAIDELRGCAETLVALWETLIKTHLEIEQLFINSSDDYLGLGDDFD